MDTIFTTNALIALGITVGAGLATVIGSFLVIFAKQTNTRSSNCRTWWWPKASR
jgi:hypothetical protein